MEDLGTGMIVPGRSEVNFAFALNDFDFSDRVLRIEITPDDCQDDGDNTDSSKKLTAEKYNNWFSSIQIKDSESSDGAKMFKNGMRESQQKNEVCLKINASEEAALMGLIRFMYGETALDATSLPDLMDLLIAADKFEVTSCMIHCVEMLLKFPMSLELALLYLELPSCVLMSEIVKPLNDAAKQFLVALYKNFTKSQEEAMQLPLSAIEVVLGSEGLQVESEDNVCDFVLKWACTSYTEVEERREILTKRLAPLICFSNMSVSKLKEVLACADIDQEHVSKLVLEALISKVERSYVLLISDSDSVDISATQCCSVGRAYRPHCVVFFDLTKDKCADLLPTGMLNSAKFSVGGKKVYLTTQYQKGEDCLGLFVMTVSDNCTMDFEISMMKKSSMEFEYRRKVKNSTVGVDGRGWRDYFGITRTKLLSEDSDYFINGVLRLKVELTLMNS